MENCGVLYEAFGDAVVVSKQCRERVKNVVTSRGIGAGLSVNK